MSKCKGATIQSPELLWWAVSPHITHTRHCATSKGTPQHLLLLTDLTSEHLIPTSMSCYIVSNSCCFDSDIISHPPTCSLTVPFRLDEPTMFPSIHLASCWILSVSTFMAVFKQSCKFFDIISFQRWNLCPHLFNLDRLGPIECGGRLPTWFWDWVINSLSCQEDKLPWGHHDGQAHGGTAVDSPSWAEPFLQFTKPPDV